MKKEKGYDMHCHTDASDGKLPLSELVEIAKEKGLEGFTVTDHDILDASKETKYVPDKNRIEVIPGIELSGKINNYLIEVVGYFVNPCNKEIEEACRINQDFRKARVGKMIYRINERYKGKLEKEITYDEVLSIAKGGSVGLNHLNQVLVERGLFKGREAFLICLEKGTPEECYVERDAVCFENALNAIISSGGVAGIPHPAFFPLDYKGELTDGSFFGLIKGYAGNKIKVIETEYPYNKVRPECGDLSKNEEFWKAIAREYDLIGVGGSDGHQKPDGPSLGDRRTPKKIVDKIRKLAK